MIHIMGAPNPTWSFELYDEPDGFFWRLGLVRNSTTSLQTLIKIAETEKTLNIRLALLDNPKISEEMKIMWSLRWGKL